MAKKKKKNSISKTGEKRNHKIFKIAIAIVLLILIIFLTYRYTEETKEKAYIKGGQDAIHIIINAANTKGGIILKNNEETIILSKYNKPINESLITPLETAEETNKTVETVNETAEEINKTVETVNETE